MMLSSPGICRVVVLILSVVVPVTTSLAADNHVVSIAELQQQVVSATQARQTNLAKAEAFFSQEPVQNAMRAAKLDSARVQKAVALLSDEELARLAARTDKVRADITGGALTNQEITYILIALATAVVILVIVAAK